MGRLLCWWFVALVLCAVPAAAQASGGDEFCVTVGMNGNALDGWGGAVMAIVELCGEQNIIGILTSNSSQTVQRYCGSTANGWAVIVTAPDTVNANEINWQLSSDDETVTLEGGAPYIHELFNECVCQDAEAMVTEACTSFAQCNDTTTHTMECCVALTSLNAANCSGMYNTTLLPFSPSCHPNVHSPNDIFLAECGATCIEARKVGVGGTPEASVGGLAVTPLCAATNTRLVTPQDATANAVRVCLATVAGWNMTFEADPSGGEVWELRAGDEWLAVLEAQETTTLFPSCGCSTLIKDDVLRECVVDGCPISAPSPACCQALTQHLHSGCADNITSAGFGWGAECPNLPAYVSDLAASVCQGCYMVNWTDSGVGTKFATCDGEAPTSWKVGMLNFHCTGGGLKTCGLARRYTVTALDTGETWLNGPLDASVRYFGCDEDPANATQVCGDFVVVGGAAWHKDLVSLKVASYEFWATTDIEETIALMPSLVMLNVSHVGIWDIATQIGLLQQLIFVDVSGNSLLKIPTQIGLLGQLQALRASSNGLVEVPSELAQLSPTLTSLWIDDNLLTELPSELCLLDNLKRLVVHGNRFSRLPSQLGQLRELIEFDAQHNQLTEIPSELALLEELRLLRLHENMLTALPSELVLLQNLVVVNLHANALTSIPPALVASKSIALFIASGNDISQDIEELQPFFDTEVSTNGFNRTIVLLDNYFYGCVELSSDALARAHMQQNCFTTCPGISVAQRSMTECLLTEVLTTPRAMGNQSTVTFQFREKYPAYRIREGVEEDTANLKWRYCLKPLDQRTCTYETKDYEDNTVTLYRRNDGTFDFQVMLVLYYRAIDKCRDEVSAMFGNVVSCDEEADTCSWLLSSLEVPIDCTFDDIWGKLEFFEFDIDTVPPSVSITARDESGAELNPGEPVVQLKSIVFELRASESSATFTRAIRATVNGCAEDAFVDTLYDMLVVTCPKVAHANEISIVVAANSFTDQAGNGNKRASFVVRMQECPEGYFENIGSCASAALNSRCARCRSCHYPHLKTSACNPHSDTGCSSLWFGLSPLWGGALISLVAMLFMRNAALFTRKRLLIATFSTFMGVADFFSDCFFVAFDTSGVTRVVALVFVVGPLVVHAVGIWGLHVAASECNQVYHLTTYESPVASAIVTLVSITNPRLLGSWHAALGSQGFAHIMQRVYVLNFVPALIRDIPQLVLQSIVISGSLSGTAVMSVVFSALSVLFGAALFLVQLRALASDHHHKHGSHERAVSTARTSVVSASRSVARSRFPNELHAELEALRKQNAELAELLGRSKGEPREMDRLSNNLEDEAQQQQGEGVELARAKGE